MMGNKEPQLYIKRDGKYIKLLPAKDHPIHTEKTITWKRHKGTLQGNWHKIGPKYYFEDETLDKY